MIRKIVFVLIIAFFCGNCFSFDLTCVPLEQALKSGKVVFVGFVNSASVVDRSLGRVSAHADVVVEECLRGSLCEKGKVVGIDYMAQVSEENMLTVKFLVGTQAIIILTKQPQEPSYKFDSDVNGGTDFLFLCNAFPYSVLDEHSMFSCQNAMTGKEFNSLSIKSIKNML